MSASNQNRSFLLRFLMQSLRTQSVPVVRCSASEFPSETWTRSVRDDDLSRSPFGAKSEGRTGRSLTLCGETPKTRHDSAIVPFGDWGSFASRLHRFYKLATASVLSNMMVPLAGLCDTAFLGHLGDLRYLAGIILASILFDYLYPILKFLRNSTNAMKAQAVGKEDSEGILLAGLRSGVIAIAIAITILLLQYPIQKLGFWILSGTPAIENGSNIFLDYLRNLMQQTNSKLRLEID